MSERRGCGYREEGGLYACCEVSPFGMPLEHFLIDPAVEWKRKLQLRSPMLVTSKETTHLVMGVGRRFYPFVPDFCEEARRMGVSKRVPNGLDITKLTPSRSKMVLIHPTAIPTFTYALEEAECPKKNAEAHECLGALWPLSATQSLPNHKVLTSLPEPLSQAGGVSLIATIETPSCHYETTLRGSWPPIDKMQYKPGLFIQVPITRFDYISKSFHRVPAELKKRFDEAKFELRVCES